MKLHFQLPHPKLQPFPSILLALCLRLLFGTVLGPNRGPLYFFDFEVNRGLCQRSSIFNYFLQTNEYNNFLDFFVILPVILLDYSYVSTTWSHFGLIYITTRPNLSKLWLELAKFESFWFTFGQFLRSFEPIFRQIADLCKVLYFQIFEKWVK